jgi:hypothetical protein
VHGPLQLADKHCNNATERSNGQLVAYTRTCIRLYAFNPNRENDAQRDYGVAWLQSNVNSENGWCTKEVRTDIKIPGNVKIHQRNPRKLRKSASAKVVTHKVVMSAAGHAEENGTVAQSYVFRPRRQVRSLVNQGATQRLSWAGSTKHKLFFQTGVVFSWNAPDTPGEFRSGLSFRFVKSQTC